MFTDQSAQSICTRGDNTSKLPATVPIYRSFNATAGDQLDAQINEGFGDGDVDDFEETPVIAAIAQDNTLSL